MNPLRLAHETLPPTPTINDFTRITPVPGGGGNYRMKIKKMATKRGGGSWLNLCNIQARSGMPAGKARLRILRPTCGIPSLNR
jgi:hypothetical protein